MGAKRKIVVPRPIQAAFNGIREQLRKCSYIYRPLYHELFVPESDFSGRSAEDVLLSFRQAYQHLFTDEWEWWHVPSDVSFIGRFRGCQDGCEDFLKLAGSAYLVLREIDETLPTYDYGEPDGWMKSLHDLAFELPTPLLDTVFTIWDKEGKEARQVRFDNREGVDGLNLRQFSHLELVHDVFVSSMAAIDLILSEERPLVIGPAFVDSPFGPLIGFEDEFEEGTEAEETAESGPPVAGRVRTFKFDGMWHLAFDTGQGVEKGTFSNVKGFSIYDVLLNHPDKHLSAGELLVEAKQITPFDERRSSDDVFGHRGKNDIRNRMAEIEKEIDDTVNPERLDELRDELAQLKKHWVSGMRHFGRSKKLDDPEEKRRLQVKSQLNRARQKIASHMPKFGEYLRVTVKVVGGDFIYHPI